MVLYIFAQIGIWDCHLGWQQLVLGFNGQLMLQLREAKVRDILAFEVVVEQCLIDDLDYKFPFIFQGIDNAKWIGAFVRNRFVSEILNEHRATLDGYRKTKRGDFRAPKKEKGPCGPFFLDLDYVCGLQALGTFIHRELHGLTLAERLEPSFLNGSVMDEDIVSGGALDETKSLGVVKPLDCTLLSHTFFL
jgi:hypothetical protein